MKLKSLIGAAMAFALSVCLGTEAYAQRGGARPLPPNPSTINFEDYNTPAWSVLTDGNSGTLPGCVFTGSTFFCAVYISSGGLRAISVNPTTGAATVLHTATLLARPSGIACITANKNGSGAIECLFPRAGGLARYIWNPQVPAWQSNTPNGPDIFLPDNELNQGGATTFPKPRFVLGGNVECVWADHLTCFVLDIGDAAASIRQWSFQPDQTYAGTWLTPPQPVPSSAATSGFQSDTLPTVSLDVVPRNHALSCTLRGTTIVCGVMKTNGVVFAITADASSWTQRGGVRWTSNWINIVSTAPSNIPYPLTTPSCVADTVFNGAAQVQCFQGAASGLWRSGPTPYVPLNLTVPAIDAPPSCIGFSSSSLFCLFFDAVAPNRALWSLRWDGTTYAHTRLGFLRPLQVGRVQIPPPPAYRPPTPQSVQCFNGAPTRGLCVVTASDGNIYFRVI